MTQNVLPSLACAASDTKADNDTGSYNMTSSSNCCSLVAQATCNTMLLTTCKSTNIIALSKKHVSTQATKWLTAAQSSAAHSQGEALVASTQAAPAAED
jgi:hypothetical protein